MKRLAVLILAAGACAAPPPDAPGPDAIGAAPAAERAPAAEPGPFRVILMIGDGTGVAQWSAGRLVSPRLAIDRFPEVGLVETRSSDSWITDSAAGATAFATGVRTYNGAIGVAPDSTQLLSVLEVAESHGWATGLVATSTITHATPAAFAAHVPSRNMQWEIAEQLTDARVEVLLGGGRRYFDPAEREDGQDLLGRLAQRGVVVETADALMGLERFSARDQVGYDVLISPDEEIGSLGSGPRLAELGARADVGMTYEPALADGSLAGARKGSGNFSLRVRGKAAHAGREHHLGRNAIIAAADFARRLDTLNGARDQVTFNVSRIEGGGAPNVVPDIAVVRFNARAPDKPAADWAEAEMKSLCAAINERDGITADLHGGFTRPPKPMTPANRRMFDWTRSAGLAIGLDIAWNDTGGVCEGNNLWASGCPNVDTLGVRGADIHSDREIAKLSSFAEKAKLSAILLMKFASGTFDAREARALARGG